MRNLLILGGGESGVGAALLAQKHAITCTVSDAGSLKSHFREELLQAHIPFEEGGHSEEVLLSATLVVKSPGIPDDAPIIMSLHERGIEVISEIEFAYRLLPSTQRPVLIGITGSNGKTTTVGWITHLLKKGGFDAVQCGNVGRSFARLLAEEPLHSHYCIELSSFQLDGMPSFRPDVAILLNITADHLDRYQYSIANYAQSKVSIARNMQKGDLLVYWGDCPLTEKFLPSVRPYLSAAFSTQREPCITPKAFLSGDTIQIHNADDELIFTYPVSSLALSGEHNIQNSMASLLAAFHLGVSVPSVEDGLKSFVNVPHRLELVATIDDVDYINDSKATNIDAARYALSAQQRPVILILGGTDKGNDYSTIAALVKEKCKALIFLGVDNDKLHKAFDHIIARTADARSMKDAIAIAAVISSPGDVVLLSPCCASFDLFKNYEDRGDQFRSYAQTLQKQ